MLGWLWLVIVFALLLAGGYQRRKKLLNRFTEEKFVGQIAAGYSERKAKQKIYLLVLVVLFSVLALTRPQWGFRWQEVKRQGIDIIVVVDTSKSMLTQDVKPNRLERTKFAVAVL